MDTKEATVGAKRYFRYIMIAFSLTLLIFLFQSDIQTTMAIKLERKPVSHQNGVSTINIAQETILFSDDFSGDLSNWDIFSGSWFIDQGVLVGDANNYPDFASIYAGDPSWTDYVFQTRVVTETLNTVLILRSLERGQTEYRVEFWWEGSNEFANSYYVYKYQDGVFEELSDGYKDANVPITSESTLKVQVSGGHLLLYVDDHYVADIIDNSPIPNGQVGLGVLWDTASFDDVLVTTVPPIMIYPVEDVKFAHPGEPITYTLEVANYIGKTDSFNLEVLPGTVWTTTLSTDLLGPIENGESESFTTRVDIPPDAVYNDYSVATIQATSITSPTIYTTSILTSTAISNSVAYVLTQDSLVLVDRILHIPEYYIELSQYGCTHPDLVKLTPDMSQVYIACFQSQQIIVFNTTDNSYEATIALPSLGNSGDLTFTRDGAYAVASVSAAHFVNLINTSSYTVIRNINTVYPMTLATHPYMPYIYIGGYINYGPDYIQILNTNTFTIEKSIKLDCKIYDVQPSPDGLWIYASGIWDVGQLFKIDANTNTVVDSLSGWNRLYDIKVLPDGSKLFVRDLGNIIHVIDGINLSEITSFLFENSNSGMELSCDGSELWINTQQEDLPVIDTQDYSFLYSIHIPDSSTRSIAMCSSVEPGVFTRKVADDKNASPGKLVNFTISLFNYDDIDLDNIVISDTLPVSLAYKDGSLNATSGSYNFEQGVITWTGSMTAGNSLDINFGATVLQSIDLGSTITNTAVFSTPTDMYLRNEVLEITPWQILMPCMIKPCSPAYLDNFSNPSSGWPIAEDTVAKLGYVNGEYQIMVKEVGWVVFAVRDFNETEYKVEVDTWPLNNLSGATGLIFGLTNNGFYLFEISNGYYSLWRFDNGSWAEIIYWRHSDAINPGFEVNHLEVIRKQSSITLYANDIQLGSTNDSTYMGTGLGMVSDAFSDNFDGRFDNFAISLGVCIGSPNLSTIPPNILNMNDSWVEKIPGTPEPEFFKQGDD